MSRVFHRPGGCASGFLLLTHMLAALHFTGCGNMSPASQRPPPAWSPSANDLRFQGVGAGLDTIGPALNGPVGGGGIALQVQEPLVPSTKEGRIPLSHNFHGAFHRFLRFVVSLKFRFCTRVRKGPHFRLAGLHYRDAHLVQHRRLAPSGSYSRTTVLR